MLIGQKPRQEEAEDVKCECPYSWKGVSFGTGTSAKCRGDDFKSTRGHLWGAAL